LSRRDDITCGSGLDWGSFSYDRIEQTRQKTLEGSGGRKRHIQCTSGTGLGGVTPREGVQRGRTSTGKGVYSSLKKLSPEGMRKESGRKTYRKYCANSGSAAGGEKKGKKVCGRKTHEERRADLLKNSVGKRGNPQRCGGETDTYEALNKILKQ